MPPCGSTTFGRGNRELESLLEKAEVSCHLLVVGEVACGNLRNRSEILALLHALPMANPGTHEEVVGFIDSAHLMGKGLGFIDAHLLFSATVSPLPLWTLDKRLQRVAAELGCSYT